MKSLVFGFILLCALPVLNAQTPEWQWATGVGGAWDDCGGDIAVDGQGNLYVTGYFEQTAAFGLFSLTSAGAKDIFISKQDAAGNWLWAVRAGGIWDDSGAAIAVDGEGNAYLTGYFQSTSVAFGSYTLISSGEHDIFAAKLDPEGNWLWAVRAGGVGSDFGSGIALDEVGDVYLTGGFADSADFGSHILASSGFGDIFAAKLDHAGNWLWAVRAGGTNEDSGSGIAMDAAGYPCFTGFFHGEADFGPHILTSSGGNDIFAAT